MIAARLPKRSSSMKWLPNSPRNTKQLRPTKAQKTTWVILCAVTPKEDPSTRRRTQSFLDRATAIKILCLSRWRTSTLLWSAQSKIKLTLTQQRPFQRLSDFRTKCSTLRTNSVSKPTLNHCAQIWPKRTKQSVICKKSTSKIDRRPSLSSCRCSSITRASFNREGLRLKNYTKRSRTAQSVMSRTFVIFRTNWPTKLKTAWRSSTWPSNYRIFKSSSRSPKTKTTNSTSFSVTRTRLTSQPCSCNTRNTLKLSSSREPSSTTKLSVCALGWNSVRRVITNVCRRLCVKSMNTSFCRLKKPPSTGLSARSSPTLKTSKKFVKKSKVTLTRS